MTLKNYFLIYIKKYRRHFLNGVIFLAVTDVLDVIPPLILMKGVDQITGNAGRAAIMHTALLFAAVTVLLAFVRFHWRMQFGKFHQSVSRDLRNQIFEKLTKLGSSFYAKNPIGELMSLITNDVEAVRMGMGPGVVVLLDSLLYFLTIPPIMFSLSVPLTFETLALLPLLPFFVSWLGEIINRRFSEVQEQFSKLSGLAQENIAGIRVIKSYTQEQNQLNVFNRSSEAWVRANLKVAWAESFMHPVMEFCVSIGVVVLLFLGSKQVLAQTLTLGGFVAFQRYISKMAWPMTAIGWGYSLISQARASVARIEEFMATPLDVVVETAPDQKFNLDGPIEIKNLSFSFPGSARLALQKINIAINPGDTLGLVGPVGSGKTALAQLLCHLYEVKRGEIVVNGHDLRDIPLPQLRRHISLVPQDAFLFSTSISENMRFGTELPETELEVLKRVAQIAKLDEEIEGLPGKFEALLGERGINLSGGQKQRVTLTRALLRDSPVIIFDDSLSAVDAETEALILKRLQQETKRRTTILISHRLSTLSLCNKIAVLKDGRLEAFGSPQELKKSSVTYNELLSLQGYT